jgi:hypothetical protein
LAIGDSDYLRSWLDYRKEAPGINRKKTTSPLIYVVDFQIFFITADETNADQFHFDVSEPILVGCLPFLQKHPDER